MSRLRTACFLFAFTMLFCGQQALASDAKLKEGLQQYKELEFTKARAAFEAYLRTPKLTKTNKVNALRHLVICYYNEGQKSQAKDVWRQTLKLDRNAKLPAGQSPDVQAFFATVKPPPLPRRRLPPGRRIQAPKPSTPSGFRHTASVITLGLGVAAAGIGLAFGVLAQGSAAQAAQQEDPNAALTETNAAATNANISTGLWIGSAALLTGGVIIFIVEAVNKPKPQASLPPQRSTALVLHTTR